MGLGEWGRAGIVAALALAGCGGAAAGKFPPDLQGVDAQVGFDAGGAVPVDATGSQPRDAATGTADAAQADAGTGGGPDAGRDAGGGARDAGADTGVSLPPLCSAASAPVPASVDHVGRCGATLAVHHALRVATAFEGESFTRCGSVGSETSWQVTLSPDASRLAARTSAGTVRLFSTRDWREIAQLAAPVGQLDAAAFSPDGTTLATVSREMGALLLWSARDGRRLQSFFIPPRTTVGNPTSALAYASDGHAVATTLDAMLDLQAGALTDWTTGKPILPPRGLSPDLSPIESGNDVIIVQGFRFVGCDSRLLVWGGYDGGMTGMPPGVQLIDPATGHRTTLAGGLYAVIDGVAASRDGRWIALAQHGDQGGNVTGVGLFDATTGALFSSDPTETGTVLGFSPDGGSLYTATSAEIDVRAVPSLALERQLPLLPDAQMVGVSPSGLLIVSRPGFSLWVDPTTGLAVRRAHFTISSPSFSADGSYGVSSGGDGALFHLWREGDVTDLCAPAAPPPGASPLTTAFSPDGATLGIFRADGLVDLRPVASDGAIGAPTASVATGLGDVYQPALALANGGGRFAVLGNSPDVTPQGGTPTLEVFDVTSGQSLFTRPVQDLNQVMALSSDGTRLAFLDESNSPRQVTVVAVAGGAPLAAFSPAYIDSFSPDGTRLALPDGKGMQIWRLADGQQETTFGPGTPLGYSALSPNWTRLAQEVFLDGSLDVGLRLWDPTSGELLTEIDGMTEFSAPPRVDDTGAIAIGPQYVDHDYADDWWSPTLWDLHTGKELRIFHAADGIGSPLGLPFARGTRVLTGTGSVLAVWCR